MISIYHKKEVHTNLSSAKPGSWINVINPSLAEIKHISEHLSLPRGFLSSALDPDETPRVENENGDILILIRIPFVNDELKPDTLPLGMIITKKYFLTVSKKETSILNFYNLEENNFDFLDKTKFCLKIMSKANIYYQKFLLDIEKKIERIEKSILRSLKNEEIIQLLGLEKSLTYMSTAILSNEKVIERLLNGRILKLTEVDKDLLEDLLIDNKQSIEMVNIYINILTNTMDAYASLVSNNLNMVMKFLASITIIMGIPSIISSFYGMNVSVPFENHQNAFGFVVGITMVLTGVVSWYFLKKGYL